MLTSASPLKVQIDSFDDEKSWCSISLESQKESIPVESVVVDIDISDCLPLVTPISTSVDQTNGLPCYSITTTTHHRVRHEGSDSNTTTAHHHPFTFRCRPRSFPACLISPPLPADPLLSCATSPPSTKPKPKPKQNSEEENISTHVVSKPIKLNGAGPTITEIENSLVACSIEPLTRELYSTLSKRRFGFDTSLSNVQYGYASSKPYRFTSPLSPDPKIRKRSKYRRHKPKSTPCSLLQKTLRRTHADALRKRYPPRSISPPNCDSLPPLDEDDDEDEFDDDEDDEIIDDFDVDDDDVQVDDIVDLYNQRSPEQDLCGKYNCVRGGPEPISTATAVADGLIHISSTIMTDVPGLEPVALKPVLEETGAFVYVADNSDF